MNRSKPRRLCPGDTIGIVAPSGPLQEPERLPEAVNFLESLGYRVRLGQHVYDRDGFVAGADKDRAYDLMQMFLDDSVQAVFCARGGYGAGRLLPLLDFPAIQKHPKLFSGYSDITILHQAFASQCGFVTFHGLMAAVDLVDAVRDPWSVSRFLRLLTVAEPFGKVLNPPDAAPSVGWQAGRAAGRLIGGNLQLLSALCGTPYPDDYHGAILFIEEINEKPYSVDRMLLQLTQTGALDACAGFALGNFNNCIAGTDDTQSLERVLQERLMPLGKPIVAGLTVGHCHPNGSLPFGVMAEVDGDKGTLTVLESAVV